MDKYSYTTKGVCSKKIDFTVEDGIITDAAFTGGCNGNTQGVCALVRSMSVEEAIKRMDGIHCGPRPTSCPDQFAQALKEYLASKN